MLADVNEAQGRREAPARWARPERRRAFVRCDVSRTRRSDARGGRARSTAFGRLDILVANAGIVHAADFLDLEEADFDRVLAVNLKGVFLAGPGGGAPDGASQGGGGAIVNMSSVNAVLAIPNQVPYVVSKGGINQLTKVMALALAPHGIRVNGIGPGTILTELAKTAVLGNREAERKILSRTPMGRMGEPGGDRARSPPSSRATTLPTSRARPSTPTAGGSRSTTPCRWPTESGKLRALDIPDERLFHDPYRPCCRAPCRRERRLRRRLRDVPSRSAIRLPRCRASQMRGEGRIMERFNQDVKTYKECMKTYIDERQAAMKANEAAANDAIAAYNAIMKHLNEQAKGD